MSIASVTVPKRLRIRLFLLILCLPVAFLYVCIYNYGVNVVFWDEWQVVRLYDDIMVHGISFEKLFAQHNEHRMFFPNILMLLTYSVTKWNTKVTMYISAFFLSLTYYYIIKYTSGKKSLADFKGKDVFFYVLLGFCLMSTCQYENLLWGFQVAWFLIVICVTASLVFFKKYYQNGNRKDCVISIFFATVSTYSSLQGMAVWFMYLCIFIIMLFTERKCMDWKIWVPYVVLGISEIILYFQGYSSVSHHENYRMDSIRQCFRFMASQLGYLFCDSNTKVAEYLGVLLILLALLIIGYLLYRKKAGEYLISIGMIIFGMGVTLMISIGRSQLSLTSRYTTYVLMVLIGVLSIIYSEVDQNLVKRIGVSLQVCQIFVAVEGMLLALCMVESLDSLEKCAFLYQGRTEMTQILQNYKNMPLESLHKSFPWADYNDAYKDILILSEKGWNTWENVQEFYGTVQIDDFDISTEPLDTYNIENIMLDDSLKILTISGWAVDNYTKHPYTDVYVKINHNIYESSHHQERMDVSKYFGNPEYKNSGFSISKSAEVLMEGVNTINLLLTSVDDHTTYLSEDTYIYYVPDSEIYYCDKYGNKILQ